MDIRDAESIPLKKHKFDVFFECGCGAKHPIAKAVESWTIGFKFFNPIFNSDDYSIEIKCKCGVSMKILAEKSEEQDGEGTQSED